MNAPTTQPPELLASGAAWGACDPALPAGAVGSFTCAASVDRVFCEVADIENLPRWAGGFCERVYLARGRWMALTSLGEMYLALDADQRSGSVTLGFGWDEQELHEVAFQIATVESANGGRGTRVSVRVGRSGNDGLARVGAALGSEWPGLVARCGGGVGGKPGR